MADLEPVSGGYLLRRYRSAAGFTQEELAERAGLSARAIRALESGERRAPHKDTLQMLATALGLSAAERSLLEARMRQRSAAPARPALETIPRPLTPLVGRQRERALIERWLREGGPPLVLFAGEPGIGKSRLLQEVSVRAGELGWTVLAAGCHRRSAQQPYAPFVDALLRFLASRSPAQRRQDTRGCAWLARLAPELTQQMTAQVAAPALTWKLPVEQERRLMFAAVARLLANVAGPAGVVLLLDDLHWAGVDAIDLLAFLARADDGRRVRVIGAFRDTDVAPGDPLPMLVADLARDEQCDVAPLTPLARDEAAQLLAALLADAPSGLADSQPDLLTRAGGVPFYLVSCAQEARVGALTAQTAGNAIPWSAAESIRQRAAVLSAPARDALTIAAVNGRQIARDTLTQVAAGLGYGEKDILDALDATIRARLLSEGGETYVFTHDLIQETLARDVSGVRHAALHRRIGEALERLPAPLTRAAELAWHFAQAGDLARALPYALHAGDRAETTYAHDEASQHYQEALAWARALGDQPHEAEALEKLAETLYRQARYEDAFSTLEHACAIYRTLEDWERLAWTTAELARVGDPLGRTELSMTRLDDLFTLLSSVAQRQSSDGPQRQRALGVSLAERAQRGAHLLTPQTAARVYLCLTTRLLFLQRHTEVYAPSEQAIRFACAAGALRIESLGYAFRAEAQQALGKFAAAARSLERARERARASGDIEALYVALSGVVGLHHAQGELPGARAALDQMLSLSRQLGDMGHLIGTLCDLAAYALALGEWPVARRHLAEAIAALNRINRAFPPEGAPPNASAQGGRIVSLQRAPGALGALRALLHGEDVSAQTLAEAEDDEVSPLWLWTLLALSERDILAGRAQRAAQRLARASERTLAPDNQVYLLTALAWAQAAAGESAAASQTLSAARVLADRRQNRFALAEIARVSAALASAAGRWDEARRTLEEALRSGATLPYPYLEAKARALWGAVAAALGAQEQAQAQYALALALCKRLDERLYRPTIERALMSH